MEEAKLQFRYAYCSFTTPITTSRNVTIAPSDIYRLTWSSRSAWVVKHPEKLDRWPMSEQGKRTYCLFYIPPMPGTQTSVSPISKPPPQRFQIAEHPRIQICSKPVTSVTHHSQITQVPPSAIFCFSKRGWKLLRCVSPEPDGRARKECSQ